MIEQLRRWFEANHNRHVNKAKNNAFWSVLPSLGSQKSLQVNYEVGDLDGSWQLLEDYILGIFQNGVRQVVVMYKTAANDGNPSSFPLKNPAFNSQSNGIFGMQGGNTGGIGQIIQLQNENHRTQLQAIQDNHKRDLEQLKTEFKHTKEIEELKGEIYAISEQQMTFWDKVLDRIENNSDLLMPVIEGIVNKVTKTKTQIGIAGVTTDKNVPRLDQESKEKEETVTPVTPDLNTAAKAAQLLAEHGYESDLLLRAATFLVSDKKKATFLISQLPK